MPNLICSAVQDLPDMRSSRLCSPWQLRSEEPPRRVRVPVHVPHLVQVFLLRLSCLLWFVSMLCFIIQPVSARPFKAGPIWICQGVTCCWMGHCEVKARRGNRWKRNVPMFKVDIFHQDLFLHFLPFALPLSASSWQQLQQRALFYPH